MSKIEATIIHSLDDLFCLKFAWDDLWQRSSVAIPTTRCELVAHWIEQFSGERNFKAVLVREAGELVCALPLVLHRRKEVIPAVGLPNNEWSPHGDLLLDEGSSVPEVLDALLQVMGPFRHRLLWFEGINRAEPRWQAFLAALERASWQVSTHELDAIGTIDLTPDWETYSQSLSRNSRHNNRRSLKKLNAEGDLTLRRETFAGDHFDADALDARLQQVLEVENRSWKGPLGTTILRAPGMWPFFQKIAHHCAGHDMFELDTLELNGEPVAFEFGYRGKGTFFCHKISFDEQYSAAGPSRALRQLQVQQFFADGDIALVDYMGPITPAVESWANGSYTCSRLVAATPNWWSRLWFAQYKRYRLRQDLKAEQEASPQELAEATH